MPRPPWRPGGCIPVDIEQDDLGKWDPSTVLGDMVQRHGEEQAPEEFEIGTQGSEGGAAGPLEDTQASWMRLDAVELSGSGGSGKRLGPPADEASEAPPRAVARGEDAQQRMRPPSATPQAWPTPPSHKAAPPRPWAKAAAKGPQEEIAGENAILDTSRGSWQDAQAP